MAVPRRVACGLPERTKKGLLERSWRTCAPEYDERGGRSGPLRSCFAAGFAPRRRRGRCLTTVLSEKERPPRLVASLRSRPMAALRGAVWPTSAWIEDGRPDQSRGEARRPRG